MNVNNTKKPEFFFKQENILFEDNHILIYNKMPGDIVQGDKTGDSPLSEILKQYLKEKYKKPGNVFLGVVHRLDRPVSGAVIFARTSKALTRLNQMLKDREIKKTYWAVTENFPEKTEAHLIHFLKKNESQNKSFTVNSEDQKGLLSELKYRCLGSSQNYHLLEIELLTGRHHQIRVQLSAIGCNIKGDLKYGAKRPNKDASIHLHARKIEFIHPVSKQNFCLIANPPDDPVWNHFLKQNY